jgi:hypothetical protein
MNPPLFHLGLRPENVVVTAAAEAVVLDFGLAAALRGMGGCPIEKWHFVAPELIGVDAAEVSVEMGTAADLFSLGALLYFLLSGRQPVEAATLAELSERVWEPLPEAPGVAKRLFSVVHALTAPLPKDRPASARLAVEWLSRGIDYADERNVGKALQALGVIAPVSSLDHAAPDSPAAAVARPGALGKRHAFASPMASGRPKSAAARAVGSTGWPRHSRPLLAGIGLLAFGLSVWGVSTYRGSRERGHPIDAGGSTMPARLEDPRSNQAEITVLRSPDGGLHPRGGEAPPTVEPYRADFEGTPSRVPGHLFLDTNPSQADVWVDGVLRGKTPVDLVAGPGIHRVVAIKAGYRILPEVFDTTRGQYARRGLQRAGFPNFGDALLEVQCETADKFPVVLDDEETGLLCPVSRLPVPSGKHHVGIFVPAKRAVVAVEVTVPPGREPRRVILKE